jgi:Uma2 family endonuclease
MVVIEVLSKTTEAKDRGEKAEEYRSLPSLQEYLLIAQDRYHVEHYVRQSNQQWLLTEYHELHETIQLPSINCQLRLADIYDKWELLSDET